MRRPRQASAVASWAIVHSSYGRTLRAIRENEKLAASLGINVGRHKIGAFVHALETTGKLPPAKPEKPVAVAIDNASTADSMAPAADRQ